MSQSPFEQTESLRIGSVDFVSPDEVKATLEIEAPESVALNAGGARPFPRVNGYVLVPVDDAYLVGQIEWLTVERSAFPKRRGMQDFGLIDLPYPLRRMSLNPIGTLRRISAEPEMYMFRRGADAFPSIGSAVLLPTDKQLRSIVESGQRRRVKIGTSPLAGDAEVRIDPDRLFGRHLAVLGNTGSGKSCSVAGLIRWSLEYAQAERGSRPNARFIVLDPNGEYSRAFSASGLEGARVFTLNPKGAELPLQVPLWFWNSSEWCSFTQASSKTQRPTLVQALRSVRGGEVEPDADRSHGLRRFLRTIVAILRVEANAGTPWGVFPKPKGFLEKLEKWNASLAGEVSHLYGPEFDALQSLVGYLEELAAPRRIRYAHLDFTLEEVQELIRRASVAHAVFGGSSVDHDPVDVDAPSAFSGDALLRSVEATAEMLNVSEYAETLLLRIRSLLQDTRMQPVTGATNISLADWLGAYVGEDDARNGCVSVIDMSLLPTDVIHVLTSVVARMIFEALQRYRKLNLQALPTVLVMEEAHTFVKRYREDADNPSAAAVCCQVFERIAREGRKYGLGLVLSSQRPSELSATVLSQCNSFLLHRISNDRDQELVQKWVPDNLRGLLRELPSLPSQYALLMGWASELPVMVKMRDLPQAHQPRSDDPDFWNVWVGASESGDAVLRSVDWNRVAHDWQAHTR